MTSSRSHAKTVKLTKKCEGREIQNGIQRLQKDKKTS